MKEKCILITGGAGFIGSGLCKKLQAKGNKVYSLDNYFTGNVLNHVDGVTYIKGSASNIKQLINFSPDIVFHLGEYSRVEQSFEDIDIVWQFNREGIISVLEFCKSKNSKLVYAGSSTKFGDGGLGRMQSPYAFSKASNTELVMCYGNWFNLPYAITYFYNVYGGNEISEGRYATLIGIFKEKMKKGLPMPVVLPGNQLRNFTHIDDIVDGLILVGETGYGDEYGIGSNESFSVHEVAEMFSKEIEFLPERPGNRLNSDVITDKTIDLGWNPKKKLREYIEELKEF